MKKWLHRLNQDFSLFTSFIANTTSSTLPFSFHLLLPPLLVATLTFSLKITIYYAYQLSVKFNLNNQTIYHYLKKKKSVGLY